MKQIFQGLLLGLIIEICTAVMRFHFGLESSRDTAFISNFTAGIRIHHGYAGILLSLIALFLIPKKDEQPAASARNLLLIMGVGLIASDLLHHFILWRVTGSPQFDIFYPNQ